MGKEGRALPFPPLIRLLILAPTLNVPPILSYNSPYQTIHPITNSRIRFHVVHWSLWVGCCGLG